MRCPFLPEAQEGCREEFLAEVEIELGKYLAALKRCNIPEETIRRNRAVINDFIETRLKV